MQLVSFNKYCRDFVVVYYCSRQGKSLGSNYYASCFTSMCSWFVYVYVVYTNDRRSQWPRGLRLRSAAVRLLRSWVRIPPAAWMFVCCECCVLSGRGLCDALITRPEESYRLWCVVVCDLETSRMRRPWPALGRSATKKNIYIYIWMIGRVAPRVLS